MAAQAQAPRGEERVSTTRDLPGACACLRSATRAYPRNLLGSRSVSWSSTRTAEVAQLGVRPVLERSPEQRRWVRLALDISGKITGCADCVGRRWPWSRVRSAGGVPV